MDKIDRLIINGPYEEPSSHWRYERETKHFRLEPSRRPAGYMVATPNAKGHDDPGQFVALPVVNEIRGKVDAWRGEGYPGVTLITRKLLEHWQDTEQRERRFFFCQLEAIETLVWLVETPEGSATRKRLEGDGGDFERLCSKMATGTGKTIVMAMLIAWNFLNKAANPGDDRFSKYALIVAPGLTVKERLQVLNPQDERNYYTAFDIVPPGMMERLRQGKVLIHNWHTLAWDSQEKLDAKAEKGQLRSVDKRKQRAISDVVYIRQVLGQDMPEAHDMLVINDEAHHAWRVNPKAKDKYRRQGEDKDSAEEATVWVGGLDRLHRQRGILRCFDLSATPFMPSGGRTAEESLFTWVVSDFSLNDAIESGLVKTPRVVVADDSMPDKDYKSRLFHIYKDEQVKDDLNRKKVPENEPLPDLVSNAYMLLGRDWLETRREWKAAGRHIPPAMITVANNLETSARIRYSFARQNFKVDSELATDTGLLQIDSKALGKAESLDEQMELTIDKQKGPTKDQQAELLRRKVSSVGEPGEPGEQVCNVISVGMLSEGWDAKNVTHIMGLRAFSSQLLCEQVVGRGLRRISYDIGEDQRFDPEYVNIFGVPFTFLPHEAGTNGPPPPEKPSTRIAPLREKKGHAIQWPNVLRVDYTYKPRLALDWDALEPLELDPYVYITSADYEAMLDGKFHSAVKDGVDLVEEARETRLQTSIFAIAKKLYEQRGGCEGWKGSKFSFLAQVIPLVERFIRTDMVTFKGSDLLGGNKHDDTIRKILFILAMRAITQHLWGAIQNASTEDAPVPVFDKERPILSTGGMRPWYTRKPCTAAAKSHISHCVFDSRWEAAVARELDRSQRVDSFVKNDHLGFAVFYVHDGSVRKYYPDFLIKMANGEHLVLEVKGQEDARAKAKHAALAEWCKAVNAHGSFGLWHSAVAYSPSELKSILTKSGSAVNSAA